MPAGISEIDEVGFVVLSPADQVECLVKFVVLVRSMAAATS